jgi:multicomponent Na+:H+ antiporter subunit G
MIIELMIYTGCVLLLLGAGFSLLAAIGVVRFPDLLTRMHAASKAGAVGGGLVLLAVALVSFDSAVALRAVFGIVFLLLTTPVSAHLLARVAYLSGRQPTTPMVLDELTSKRR